MQPPYHRKVNGLPYFSHEIIEEINLHISKALMVGEGYFAYREIEQILKKSAKVFKRSFIYYLTYPHRGKSKHEAANLLLGKELAGFLEKLEEAAKNLINEQIFDTQFANSLLSDRFFKL